MNNSIFSEIFKEITDNHLKKKGLGYQVILDEEDKSKNLTIQPAPIARTRKILEIVKSHKEIMSLFGEVEEETKESEEEFDNLYDYFANLISDYYEDVIEIINLATKLNKSVEEIEEVYSHVDLIIIIVAIIKANTNFFTKHLGNIINSK